ncbi:MAG: riboflavin biosynthesis protein RibF [Candidatus Omnitrophota bacterium]
MKVVYRIADIKKSPRAIVALGVFDGVHLAHRRILQDLVKKARAIKGEGVVVTFWPHPQKKEMLYSLEHRLKLISDIGIDTCIVIKFNKQFSLIPAERFITDILVKRIGAKYIYIGRNFRFGYAAEGGPLLLARLASVYHLELRLYEVMKIKGRQISSTHIRKLITTGNLKLASLLLGNPVSVLGTVVRGNSLAKGWGLPTANIDPHHEVSPPSGVYVAKVRLNKMQFSAICYVGTRPTITKQKKKKIEVHILGFNKKIYGKTLQIEFMQKIRQEKKFASTEALVKQIKKDILRSKKILSLH